MIVKARFAVPLDSPPIENAAIRFENGIILDVGAAASSSPDDVDYGDAVILPGFVNAHTHLELTLLADRVPPSLDFTNWLNQLISTRNHDSGSFTPSKEENPRGRNAGGIGNGPKGYFEHAVKSGISQSLTAGVTTVADITAYPRWTRPVLARSPLRGVSFGEVIAMGKGRTHLQSRLDAAADESEQTEWMKIGISPHAPYTVEPDALHTCADLAARNRLPLSIHVAETPGEEEFTRERTGPFADFLAQLGLWDEDIPISRCSPVELLAAAGLLTPSTILAHANYASNSDIALIAESGASVAFCPRTHAAFGHAAHRLRDMLATGINVCLGTDSLASNPSLSILDEVRFLWSAHNDILPDQLLAMATLHGARALKLDSRIGSLSAGKLADFCVVALRTKARQWVEVVESSNPVMATYVGGELISGG